MNDKDFVKWLEGFIEGIGGSTPSVEQWLEIIKKIQETKTDSCTGFCHSPNMWYLRYSDVCSCHPRNGGSGICNCTLGNTLVDAPKPDCCKKYFKDGK